MGLEWLESALAGLEARGLLRTRRSDFTAAGPEVETLDGQRLLNLCSNDYLSLSGLVGGRVARGAGASRLVGGDLEAHRHLERSLAAWLGYEEALLFTSGYAANVGVISALADGDTCIVSDSLNHASLIDGCRLSRGRTVVVDHRDARGVEDALAAAPERKRLVITDGYFSMDGDVAPMRELRAVCDRHGAVLMVDEAHALGVLGPDGRGVSAEARVVPDVLVGTLGKAFGAGGAFVAGSRSLSAWLWNRARSFVFSTGLSPLLAEAATSALELIRAGDLTRAVLANASFLRAELAARAVAVAPESVGPIVPILLGGSRRALDASNRLLERGIFVHPIRPPTVPEGTARLRVTVQAGHGRVQLERAAEAIAAVVFP